MEEMDFHSLKRKQLQALCKKHGLPANKTNLEMAETLTAHLQVNDNPTSNEKDPNDIPKKFKKVRFSPENETREYEPSVYRMPGRRSRRRTTLINPDSKNSKQSNVSDKVVGKKRGRGNEKIESVSRITRSQAKVNKETSSLIENETETIRSQDGCQKVLHLQERLKGLRRNAARQKSTASQEEEVSKIIDSDNVEARKGCRRSTSNVGKCKNSELIKAEVVGRVTRSKAQSAGNVSAIEIVGVVKECKGAISETNELRSSRNSSRLTLVATSNEMNEIGSRDGKVGRQKRKRAVVEETESSKDVDESLVGKPPRRSTRHTLRSDFMGPAVHCKSVEKKQQRSSRMSLMIEETTLTNISPPSEDAGVTKPEAAREKNYLTSNKSNALKSYEKKGESKSKSRGKRSNASVDVSALHSGTGEEIDAATILEETVAATPIKLASTEQEESTVAGLSVVSSEKNIGLVDDTGKLVSNGSNESGADYQSSQSFEICANLYGHDSEEFKSAEFHVKACDVVSLADGLSCANQSAFPDECPSLFELEKGTARKVMSTGKDVSNGSDCISNHSTEVDMISIQEDGVHGIKSTEPDNTKDEIEHEVLPDNGKASSAVRAEIFIKSTEGVCLENVGVNDRSTEVENISVQEDGFSSPERTEQDNTTDKNVHKLVPQIRKASPDALAEPVVEDTKNIHHESDDVIEHSIQSKRESIEQDGVSGLERTKQDDTTYELRSEVVPHIGKGSLHEDGNVFSHSENIFIQFYEEGNACNATELPRTSCADEHQDGKGICQFTPEEKDCNGGQNCSATTIALKSPHTGCTTAKDDDENQQAFGTGLSFCGGNFSEQSRKCHDVADEKTITDNSNCEDERDVLSQFYLEELEDGKVSNTAIANNEVFCQQDFGDCMAGKKDVSFDSNGGQPLFMEALSEPSNQELSSQTTGRESEFSAGKNVESMAQSSKHINRIDRMEEKEKSFEGSDSQSQVDTFKKFVGDHLDEEATPEVLDGNLFDGICENSEVADKETCMMTMDMQVAQNGVALQSNCTEEPGKSNIVIVDEVASTDFGNIDTTSNRSLYTVLQLEGNAVELFNLKEKSVLESDTSDFVDLDMDVKATDAIEKVGKVDRNFKCKDINSDSDREFEKMAFSSHVIVFPSDVSSHGNNARDHQEVAEEQVKVQQGSIKEETFMNEIDCLTLNKISCENKGVIHSTEGGEAHCLHKLDDEMLTIVESKKAADFKQLDGISPFKSEVAVNCKTISAVCASPSHESEALELNLFFGEGEEFEVEKPSERALQVDLISEDSGDLPENAMITEQAATQVSEDHNGERTDVSSHGNNARDHQEVAEEEVKVQQGSVKEDTFMNEIDCLTLNKISCENKGMIHSTEGGEAHCLHKLDDEMLTIVESKKAADFEKLDGISPFKSEVVVNCKTISAVCASPSHESEALELNLFFGEGEEFEVEKPSEQALQVDLILEDAGELSENAMITEQAATQVSEDHNGECKHQMDEELPKNVMITEQAATQASEDHNCECVHQMDEKLPKNVMITESAATRVAEDQHDECENQMEEVAKLKHTYLAISDEPDFELTEESKMQDNALTKVDDDIQGSIVYELQENESVKVEAKAFKVEAKAFHVASTPVEKVSECEPSNLKQDNISNLIVENVEDAMELIQNVPETGATTVDESLVFSTLLGEDFTAGDGQSCQGKLQAPKKTNSYPQKEEEIKLNGEQLVCSVMKMKSNITGLIQETPQKVADSYLMKENPPSIKREQIDNVTAPKALLKRRALEDLRNN